MVRVSLLIVVLFESPSVAPAITVVPAGPLPSALLLPATRVPALMTMGAVKLLLPDSVTVPVPFFVKVEANEVGGPAIPYFDARYPSMRNRSAVDRTRLNMR